MNEVMKSVKAIRDQELHWTEFMRKHLPPVLAAAEKVSVEPDKELLEACEDALTFVSGTIRMESPDHESPPEPVTEADRQADMLCAYLSGVIRRAKGDP
jgi:hypothetical protein